MTTGVTLPLQLDFGPSGSAVAPGWTAAGTDLYTKERGYGWFPAEGYSGFLAGGHSPVTTYDRGTADPLTRDGVEGTGLGDYFWVDLPNGTYDVTAVLGDPAATRDKVWIWSEGQARAVSVSTAPGQFLPVTFQATVTDGRLNTSFSDLGGVNPAYTLDALSIAKAGLATPPTSSTPPSASAGPDLQAIEGGSVAFTGSAAGGPGLTYNWDFGDGTHATGTLTPSHVYADNGTYTAVLTVSNGTSTVSDSAKVVVADVAPGVTIAGTSLSATAGQPFSVRGAATDPSPVDQAAGLIFHWDFGDGSPIESGKSDTDPSHTYLMPGVYTVRLTATDKDGVSSAVATAQVTVGAPTSAPGVDTVTLTPGWATFGQVFPEGEMFGGLQVGDLPTQTDVKTTWSDGSIRYAVVTAEVASAGSFVVKQAEPSTGSFSPKIPDASVRLNIGGTVYVATLPKTVSSDVWLDGPLVREDRATVIPVGPDGQPYSTLDVIFDRRSYDDGSTRLDVTVENDMDKAGAGPVTYSVDVVADGQVVYHHDTLTQYYTTRWRQVFDLGGLTESQVVLDFEPFYEADALPRFMGVDTSAQKPNSPTGVYPSYAPEAGKPKFDILEGGDLAWDMTGHGGRPELAPYPDWAVKYLLYQDPTQKQYVLTNGDLAGSWDVHLREPVGGTYQGLGDDRMISIDERPNFWFDPGNSQAYPWYRTADGSYAPSTNYNERGNVGDVPAGDPAMAARGKWYADNNHQPSLAYIPYLVTGDRYYADEMAYWANYDLLATFQDHFYNARDGSQGILMRGNEVRGAGWALRNLSDAAAYLPDSSPLKPYFAQKVQNNLDWLDAYAKSSAGPLGVAWIKDRPGPYPNQDGIALWEHEYLAWAVDHANTQGFRGGDLWRDQVARFQLSLFNSPDYDSVYAAPYDMAIGDETPTGIDYYTSLKQVFDETYPPGTDPCPFRGNYGSAARLMLLIGIENGWDGAQKAYDYLMPYLETVPTSIYTDYDNHPGWYIVADTGQ